MPALKKHGIGILTAKGRQEIAVLFAIASQASHSDAFAHLMGWAGKEEAKKAHALIAGSLPKFAIKDPIKDYKGQRRMLWEYTRKVLGQDTPNYAQEIGDCTSFGGKNVMEYLQCVQIAGGAAQKFKPVFPPYIYGCERVYIGQGQIRGDGGMGAWVQDSVKKYGVLFSDTAGCPQYSGSVASQWGNNGPPQALVTEGSKYLVKTTAQITTAADCANALLNGYPVAVCSDWGFTMTADSQGFMQPRGTWGHCMTLIGFEDHPTYGLYFIMLNSWGDVFTHLTDFTSNQPLPIGILRVHADPINSMLAEGDSYCYSAFDGFPDQNTTLDKALFDLVGD